MRVLTLAVLLAAAPLVFLPTGSAGAPCAISEEFEGPSVGQKNAVQSVGSFTLASGSVDVLGAGFFGEYAISGHGQSLDMDGVGGGTLESGVLALPAGTYHLTFWIEGSQRGDTNTMTVSLAGWSDFLVVPSSAPEQLVEYYVVSDGSPTQLVFAHDGADALGIILDAVSLCETDLAPPVPELSGVALTGVGILGIGAFVLARRK